MQRLLLAIFVLVLSGCGTAVAQVRSANTNRTPATRMASPMSVPSTIHAMGANGSPLGAIQLNLGNLGPIPGISLGAITICPTTGITSAATNTAGDASSMMGMAGPIPSSPLSGVSPPFNSPFGTSIISGTCSPTGTAMGASAPGSSAASTLPDPTTISGSAFSDATIPLSATEIGGAGLSPLIIVPTPDVSAGPCGAISTTAGMSSLAMPNDGTGVAGTSGLSPPSGC